MSFVAGSITGTMDLDNQPTIKALRQVGEAAREAKVNVEKELGGAGKGGAEAFFHELKGGLGRRSVFGESFELLKGGGAAIGLSFAGEAIKGTVDKMVELKNEFNEGKIGAGEMTEEIAKGVPIFGKFFEAGRGIRELLTGEKAEIAAINEEVQRSNELYKLKAELLKEHRDIMREIGAETRKLQRESEAVGADPKHRELLGLAQERDDAVSRLTKDRDAAITSEKQKSDAIIAEQRRRSNEANKLNSEAQAALRDFNENPHGTTAHWNLYGERTPEKSIEDNRRELTRQASDAQAAVNAASELLTKAEADAKAGAAQTAGRFNAAIAIKEATVTAKELGANIKPLVDSAREFGEKWHGAMKEFADGAREARKEAADLLHQIGEESRTYGLSNAARELEKMEGMVGADSGMIERARQRLETMETKRVRDEFGDAVDAQVSKLQEVQKDFSEGLIDKNTLDFAAGRIKERLTDLSLGDEVPYRSTQQQSQRFQFGRLNPPEMAKGSNKAEEQLKVQQQLRDHAKAILDKLSNAGDLKIVTVSA